MLGKMLAQAIVAALIVGAASGLYAVAADRGQESASWASASFDVDHDEEADHGKD